MDMVFGVHEHGITQSDGTVEVVTSTVIRQWHANLNQPVQNQRMDRHNFLSEKLLSREVRGNPET